MRRWITRLQLRRAIQRRLRSLGFRRTQGGYGIPAGFTKEQLRELHKPNRRVVVTGDASFLRDRTFSLLRHFADGREVNPAAIDPELIEVEPGTDESALFRLATHTWSVPVSAGFGRRLRFLVRDRQNGKLVGLFGLCDPVFNLRARDEWIGWSAADRAKRLVHVMDAYVCGAVPPYSQIIGGKLVAALLTSREVMRAYDGKYLGRTSVISGVKHRARLVLLTTASALGRSSLYNRLSIPDGPRFTRLGATKGFGHFHLSGSLFQLMREYLRQRNHPYASGNRFGMGPNWKLRVARAASEAAGFDASVLLRHGIERELYGIPLARNWQQILQGSQERVYSHTQSVEYISQYCRERWLLPRSLRDSTYLTVTRTAIRQLLSDGVPIQKRAEPVTQIEPASLAVAL